MPRSVASDLILHCLQMSHKKDAKLIWVNGGRLLHFSKINFIQKINISGTILVSNSLDPDQNQPSISADLGPSYLQRVSTNNKVAFSRESVKTI